MTRPPHTPGPSGPLVDVGLLPDLAAFGGDTAAHRAWYRDHIVALVSRSDLNNTMIAAAAQVSGRTVADWFVDATGVTPREYRARHRLAKRTRVAAPDPQALAQVDRLPGPVACGDGLAAVVVDLRNPAAILRRPAARVLASAPSGTGKQWRRDIARSGDPADGVDWRLHGYGVGSNKDYAASVLLATEVGTGAEDERPTDPAEGPRRLAILTDARAHGRFAMSWVREALPTLAEALVCGGGVKPETQIRYADAQMAAALSLDALAAALADPDGWDAEVSPWSAERLGFLLAWAGAGVPCRALAEVFVDRGWGPDAAYALRDLLGVGDFAMVVEVLAEHEVGGRLDYLAWLVEQRLT